MELRFKFCLSKLLQILHAFSILNNPGADPGADPGGGQHCLGHGQIFGRAKQLFCLLVLLLVFGCGPTSGDTVGWIRPCNLSYLLSCTGVRI